MATNVVITHYLAGQFYQITDYLAGQFRRVAQYLLEHPIQKNHVFLCEMCKHYDLNLC